MPKTGSDLDCGTLAQAHWVADIGVKSTLLSVDLYQTELRPDAFNQVV